MALATSGGRIRSIETAKYVDEIRKNPILTAEQEDALAVLVAAGDEDARERMIVANLRLVAAIAGRYPNVLISFEDALSEGCLGLIRAVETFEPGRSFRFAAYAKYWINLTISLAANRACMVRVPHHMRKKLKVWGRATAALADELGRPPTEGEVADRLALSIGDRDMMFDGLAAARMRRIGNGGVGGDDEAASFSLAQHPQSPTAYTSERRELLAWVDRELDKLGEPKASIIRMRFGLDGAEPRGPRTIGLKLGVNWTKVSRIESEVIAALASLAAESGDA